ncbi:MAG: ArgE/DapE family deacylase [Candidatus Bathyarchaeia archaeon]|jgi:acetylornithine deacetylase
MAEINVDRKYVIQLLEDLVTTNSINPSIGHGPGELELSNLLCERLRSIRGLEVHRQVVGGQRSNVIAILKGAGGGRSLMLNGHMDTVGVEGMTIKPFLPSVEQGRLSGRGACDMKGGIAAMIGAVKTIAESPTRLRGDLMFAAVVDEEHMSLGTKKLTEEYKADAAIVGEPTRLRIATAHKGFSWLEIETRGKAAHGSVPEKGRDAIVYASMVALEMKNLQRRLSTRTHPLLGSPKIHTSTIEGGTDWSTVPDRCLLRIERRTLPGETSSPVKEFESIFDTIKSECPEFEAEVRLNYEMPPLETVVSEPIVRTLQDALSQVTEVSVDVVGVPYWTDGALLANRSMPTCIFGPGDISLAHSSNESVDLEEVMQAAQTYFMTAQRFCS